MQIASIAVASKMIGTVANVIRSVGPDTEEQVGQRGERAEHQRRKPLPRHRGAHPVRHRLDVDHGDRRIELVNLAHDRRPDRGGIAVTSARRASRRFALGR